MIAKRATFDLKKAQARAHIVEGYITARKSLQAVIDKITQAKDTATAASELRSTFDLSEGQVRSKLLK